MKLKNQQTFIQSSLFNKGGLFYFKNIWSKIWKLIFSSLTLQNVKRNKTMSTTIIYYDAKCKHCAFLHLKVEGKRKRFWCKTKDTPTFT